jgi:hypothetical protein
MTNRMRNIDRARAFPTGKARVRHLWLIHSTMSFVALFAVTLVVIGPIASSAFFEATPGHSHVYLTLSAATNHEHGASDAQAHDGVLSVPAHSGGFSSISLEIVLADQWFQRIQLTTSLQSDAPVELYASSFVIPPERPPRYA